MNVQVVENILKLNDELAALNRDTLRRHDVFTLNILGGPGCGKTTLVEQTVTALSPEFRIAVIVGDLTTQRDADRIARFCTQVVQVNTGKGCHLEAHHIRQSLGKIDITQLDLLLIENVGNLVCPVGFDLGQDAKVTVFCTTEGEDKPAKYPYAVDAADIILLNKIDLLSVLPFDLAQFHADIRRIKPAAKVIDLSAYRPDLGFATWLNWIRDRITASRCAVVV